MSVDIVLLMSVLPHVFCFSAKSCDYSSWLITAVRVVFDSLKNTCHNILIILHSLVLTSSFGFKYIRSSYTFVFFAGRARSYKRCSQSGWWWFRRYAFCPVYKEQLWDIPFHVAKRYAPVHAIIDIFSPEVPALGLLEGL